MYLLHKLPHTANQMLFATEVPSPDWQQTNNLRLHGDSHRTPALETVV